MPAGNPSWKKGMAKFTGRQKGSVNKTTKQLKEAILEAAEMHGANGKGKDGLVGCLLFILKEHPVAFATLLGRVLPLQISGDADNPLALQVTRIERVMIPSGKTIDAGDDVVIDIEPIPIPFN